LEVAEIFRRHGDAYCQARADHLGCTERRVLRAIPMCRTAALGGFAEYCEDCGLVRCAYKSCLMGKFRNGESEQQLRGSFMRFNRLSFEVRAFCSPLNSRALPLR
jgi:Transposase zinc-binding domain